MPTAEPTPVPTATPDPCATEPANPATPAEPGAPGDGAEPADPADPANPCSSNGRPRADAGQSAQAFVGDLIVLDGTASSDPDNDELAYDWSIVEADPEGGITLTLEEIATPILTATKRGNYRLKLLVNDGQEISEPSYVDVTIGNRQPVANAGVDVSSVIGGSVQLDGSNSGDADGDALTYAWTVLGGTVGGGVTLSNETGAKPVVNIVERGTYYIQLIVNDGELDSEADKVVISATNEAPVANAGSDAEAEVDTNVMLDGSGSYDPEEEEVTYLWTFVSVPEGADVSFDSSDAETPVFTPNQIGTYTAQLIVSDGVLSSTQDRVSIVVKKTPDDVLVDCETLPRQNMQIPISFESTVLSDDEATYPGRCEWDHDTVWGSSTQGMNHDYIQGFYRQSVVATLPENAVVCSSKISANSGNDVYWRYDDEFFLTIGDRVIVSSEQAWRMQNFVTENSEEPYGQGPYIFDFDQYKWQEYGYSYQRYCLGHDRIGNRFSDEENSSCQFPRTQRWGEFNIDIPAEAFAEVSAEIVNEGEASFSLIIGGDDDPAIDCQHSGIELNWDVEYVIPE